jgi:aspartyl-tRNA(Asn)/glutamyl-tRNA(Gln) amidotransferase subunit B
MPALPEELRASYEREGLTPYAASLLTETREKALYFEELKAVVGPQLASNWVTGPVTALVNDRNVDFGSVPVRASSLAVLLRRVEEGVISGKAAKEVLLAMADGEGDPDAIIEKRGLKQISDSGALEAAVEQVWRPTRNRSRTIARKERPSTAQPVMKRPRARPIPPRWARSQAKLG